MTIESSFIHYLGKTHRMIMAKSLAQAIRTEQLQMQNYFLEMLTATVSHDMRTPLNAILGIGRNLEGHALTATGKRFLRIVMNSAKLLNFLVNDMIDLFRIRNGKFEKHEATIDLREALAELTEIFEMQANAKGLHLILTYDESLPRLLTLDIQRISQVLINLIGNSLKFTFKGQIEVSANCITHEEYPFLRIMVRDTGVGIKEEDRDKVFMPLGKL